MKELKRNKTSSTVTLLLAALISLSSFVSIPILGTNIPLVLQNMLCVLAGCLLGGIQGSGATGLFLVAGSLGLPIFSGNAGGIAVITGPTGGYILGYFFASLLAGQIAGKPNKEEATPISKIAMGASLGFVIIYVFGTIQYMTNADIDIQEAIDICIIPFLPYDAVKLLLTVLLSIKLRPIIAKNLTQNNM